MDVSDVVFLDIEADRSGRVLAVGALRAEESFRVDLARPHAGPTAVSELTLFVKDSAIAGHNIVAHDLALLARPPLAWCPGRRSVVDTLLLSLLADPTRQSHALDKSGDSPGGLPDPLADARRARDRALECVETLARLDPGVIAFYAALFCAGGHAGIAEIIAPRTPELRVLRLADGLPDTLLARLCRVQLRRLIDHVVDASPEDCVALALAVRFVEVCGGYGRVGGPPSPALASVRRFNELATRLLGPLCPDHSCVHRHGCDVYRPFAEEILERNFELPAFRPGQREVIHAVLQGRHPLVLLPTGGGKSLCYQLPAVHGAERLHGLTVVVSPLQALMADQVGALSTRYPATCFVNSQLTMAERQQNLAGLRTGKYNIVYLGPEQLRNPSILRLLRNRPPFLWIIDEAHCISQWGHSFRTDYTYLPRAIAAIHRVSRDDNGQSTRLPPLLALFTATATTEVRKDITAGIQKGLGIAIQEMDFSARRENLAYEVIAVESAQQKDNELFNLLSSHGEGARLVYCATVRSARDVAEMLRERGVPAALYHGRLPPREKTEELQRFLRGQARTIVATSAFGMGIDKPDIRLVVHYELPGSIEDYIQETGRAGRDGQAARCVLLYSEADLETQFYLKTASQVTARDVRFVFKALRSRARRYGIPGENGRRELWVVPEELFAEEHLDVELDWDRDDLATKLKLAIYYLETDGVLERRENRTRAFGVFPALASVELAQAALPSPASPATVRVLRYLYDAERPRRLSILDIADEAEVAPSDAFREIQALTRLGLVKHDMAFELTLSKAVSPTSRELAARHFENLEKLFELGENLDDGAVVHLRSAAVETSRALERPVAPHELFHALRALRRQEFLHLDKMGPGRYRVRFEPTFVHAISALRANRRAAEALLEYADRLLGDARGRDVRCELDVNRFLRESPDLFEHRSPEEVVAALLLLHHLGAVHLADPPVVLEAAMRVAFDPAAKLSDVDSQRPKRQLAHDILLVHLLRQYALTPALRREVYLDDYFTLPRDEFIARYFPKRRGGLTRPVSPIVEETLLSGLTTAQRDAVTAEDRALLVVAGPGSGKTHTVVRRIAHMVRARQVRPDEILVLAFNRAAAAELRERLSSELGPRASRVEVRTFHSFALRLTGADLRDDARDAEQALDAALRRAADLLGAAATEDPDASEALRLQILGSIRHVIVDEYQDLDADQYRLLTALVGLERTGSGSGHTERTVYVVGDDDQAVYGFRQASVEFLRRFEHEFKARRICLSENFRSNARLIESARRFIERLPGRMKTEPIEQVRPAPGAEPGDPRSVRRFLYGSPEELSAHVAFVVKKSLAAGTGTVAVLARYWSAFDDIRCLLEREGIDVLLHHREFHRAVHRRHPAHRVLGRLWEDPVERIEGPAVDRVRAALERFKRAVDTSPGKDLLAFAEELDRQHAGAKSTFEPITTRALADELLMACRDATLRDRAVTTTTAVHLCTYHGSKGLEFDKVIILPSAPSSRASAEEMSEERRTFYVAMTRARTELVLATLATQGELANDVDAAEHDLRGVVARVPTARAGYLDCDPSHVVLTNKDLARSQRVISALREGDALDIDVDSTTSRLRLLHRDQLVAVLSDSGQRAFDALRGKAAEPIRVCVHEVYVHLDRDAQGNVTRQWLVVLPAIRVGR